MFPRPLAVATIGAIVLLRIIASPSTAAAGGSVEVERAQGNPGQGVNVCVRMSGSGGNVAGIQMELSWDPTCVAATLGGGGRPHCSKSATAGKDVHSNMLSGASMRVLLVSIADTSPMPDGDLFCCDFTVDPNPSTTQCQVGLNNVRGSTPAGQPIIDIYPRAGIVFTSSAGGEPMGGGSQRGDNPVPNPPSAVGGPSGPRQAPGAARPGGPVAGPLAGVPAGVPAEPLPPAAVVTPELPQGVQMPTPAGTAPARTPIGRTLTPGITPAVTAATAEGAPAEGAPAATSTPVHTPTRAHTPTVAPTSTPTTARGMLGGCTMLGP